MLVSLELEGIVTVVKFLQYWNEETLILFNPTGMLIDVKEMHLENAHFPIVFNWEVEEI